MSTIHAHLLQQLEESPLSFEEIADKAKVPVSTLKKIYYGHIPNPGVKTVDKLLKVVGHLDRLAG